MEVDDDFFRPFDHVIVGDDQAFLAVDHEAGAERGDFAVHLRAAALVEKIIEELFERRALRHLRQRHALRALDGLAGGNVDDRVGQPGRKRRQRLRAVLGCSDRPGKGKAASSKSDQASPDGG